MYPNKYYNLWAVGRKGLLICGFIFMLSNVLILIDLVTMPDKNVLLGYAFISDGISFLGVLLFGIFRIIGAFGYTPPIQAQDNNIPLHHKQIASWSGLFSFLFIVVGIIISCYFVWILSVLFSIH